MKKSVILFSILLVISSCTNYPSNDHVNRELIPYPDKALQEEYEKHQNESEETLKHTAPKDSTQTNP